MGRREGNIQWDRREKESKGRGCSSFGRRKLEDQFSHFAQLHSEAPRERM